ncbi:hypothetical protein H0H92_000004 [Tricholoma furcatifolium]|nr:hypothetical protein H0H92_000004 [Tricholoma furcatifolium]
MPRTGGSRRLSQPFSRQSFTPATVDYTLENKVPHRFVRIHHKASTIPSFTSLNQDRGQAVPVLSSQTTNPVDRKHDILLAKNGHFNEGEVSEVPNPTPDTGFRPLTAPTTSFLSSGSTAALNHSVHSVPLSKTALPTLSALISQPNAQTTGLQSPSFPTFFPKATSRPVAASGAADLHASRGTAQQPRKLAVPFIILLAVGCALFVIGIFSVVRHYSRPTRRPRPRPSLPVLDDPFADDKGYRIDDSPIFGGKERMSDDIGSWLHPTQSEIMTVKPPSIVAKGPSYDYDSMVRSSQLQGLTSTAGPTLRAPSTYSGHGHTQSVPIITTGNSPFQASLQQIQEALSRTASRASVTTASFYPSSPQAHNSVGIAMTRSPGTILTADGSNVLKRNESKAALDKIRNDEVEAAARGLPSRSARISEVSGYSGMDANSPSFLPYIAPSRDTSENHAGRSRIKSSYYNPNSYPRISTAAPVPMNKAAKRERQPSIRKSDARRDTQASTQALGLSTPVSDYVPPSPQPTLYPDDSLSVVETKRKQRTVDAPKLGSSDRKDDGKSPTLPVISNATDASAALGSLMLKEFKGYSYVGDTSVKRMSRSGSSKIGLEGTKAAPASPKAPKKAKDSEAYSSDKPPSIPLPELLPSLEQMGLEHANPQAYAEYKSPTYSIYGLYGGDRKSGTGY